MALSTWWKGDTLPALYPLACFRVAVATSADEIEAINGTTVAEGGRRITAGHRLYVGYLDGAPVAYGWVGTQSADIGELRTEFAIPDSDRYLWDFVTGPRYRGRGLYPRLLQAIILAEAAERFWIIHAPENGSSAAGIRKAGFTLTGHLSFAADGTPALIEQGCPRRAAAGASLLGVDVVSAALSHCWRCAQGEDGCPQCRAGEPHDCSCVACETQV